LGIVVGPLEPSSITMAWAMEGRECVCARWFKYLFVICVGFRAICTGVDDN
jgi:hypothetical protein